MDGNGRWAKRRLLPRIAGHRKGIEAAKTVVRAAGDLGVEVLTLYAFSTENWRRPADEVSDLMGLLRHFIVSDLDELAANGVRLRIIGEYNALQPDLVDLIDQAVSRTAPNNKTTLVIALNYGSQAEIVRAARRLAEQVRDGVIESSDIDEQMMESALDTAGLPPPDLLIRTSGEQRLSNFLMWQAAYAELMFVDTLWPDFGKAELAAALEDYAARERRFGGL
ncbi:MAG: isoprenyl transferase [Sphingomonadaceae bacterium]|nr:isoprenyl transferase [Sphingomonadaceae bacterium]